MSTSKRTHAVKATREDVLEEPTQEFVSREAHDLVSLIAVAPVAEGHRAIVEGDDRTVGDRGLVDVATETVGLAKTTQRLPQGTWGMRTPGSARRAR